MIESVSLTGVWWLPNSPEIRLSGTLMFSPEEGASLRIVGSFSELNQGDGSIYSANIILGATTDGKYVTLYRCIETNQEISNTGIPGETLDAQAVLIGGHLPDADAVHFSSMRVRYSDLDDWLGLSGFQTRFDTKTRTRFIEHHALPTLTNSVDQDWQISFEFEVSGPLVSSYPLLAVELRQTAVAVIQCSTERSLEEFLAKLFRLQQFLTLGVSRAVYPTNVEVTTDQITFDVQEKSHHRPMQLLYRTTSRVVSHGRIHPQKMLFNLTDIRGTLVTNLSNWFSKGQLLEPTFNLYFGTLFNDRLYLESRFLNLMQALESYHRRTMNKNELITVEHRARVKKLVECVPEALRQWLKDKLAYTNEKTLKTSLSEVRDRFKDAVGDIFTDARIKQAVDTRNYLTHYDDRLKDNVSLKVSDLHSLCQLLSLVIEICLLSELGIGVDTISTLLRRTARYREIQSPLKQPY